jgi:hypothetical protein
MLVYSSTLFLVPSAVAYAHGNGFMTLLMLALTTTSVLYHGKFGGVELARMIMNLSTQYMHKTLTLALTSNSFYKAVKCKSFMHMAAGFCGVCACSIYIMRKPHVYIHVIGALGFSLYVGAPAKI